MAHFTDLIVKCTAKVASHLINEIRNFIDQETLARRWSFDADATERISNTISEPYACFLYKDDGNTVVALLALAYTPAGEGYNEAAAKFGPLVETEYNQQQAIFAKLKNDIASDKQLRKLLRIGG